MKAKVKIIIVGILVLFTSLFCAYTIVGGARADNGAKAVDCLNENSSGSSDCFVLRDYEGYVAVYVENEPSRPMTVTDIPVSTLRELDKKLLSTGLKLYSKERLIMTLEDLGS